jgi:hypothetical protein
VYKHQHVAVYTDLREQEHVHTTQRLRIPAGGMPVLLAAVRCLHAWCGSVDGSAVSNAAATLVLLHASFPSLFSAMFGLIGVSDTCRIGFIFLWGEAVCARVLQFSPCLQLVTKVLVCVVGPACAACQPVFSLFLFMLSSIGVVYMCICVCMWGAGGGMRMRVCMRVHAYVCALFVLLCDCGCMALPVLL